MFFAGELLARDATAWYTRSRKRREEALGSPERSRCRNAPIGEKVPSKGWKEGLSRRWRGSRENGTAVDRVEREGGEGSSEGGKALKSVERLSRGWRSSREGGTDSLEDNIKGSRENHESPARKMQV